MPNYNGFEDNFDYLPDAVNPFPEDKESELYMEDKAGSKNEKNDMDRHGKPWSEYSKDDKKHYNWGRNILRHTRTQASITEDEADQLNRGQMGIMDEDSHEGDLGSPVISNKPSSKNYIRCEGCRRREEPSSPKFASWWNDGTGFPPYYCPTCVDKGKVAEKQASYSEVPWHSFYASVGDNDNPGEDEDHDSTDTDDVEEDDDSDYGGNNKRRNLSDATAATLVAMGGIGAIPQGFISKDENVHYGDEESFSHEQSKTPSQTGISGENSHSFDPFDEQWNS